MPEDMILIEQATRIRELLTELAAQGINISADIHLYRGNVSFTDHYLSHNNELAHLRTDS